LTLKIKIQDKKNQTHFSLFLIDIFSKKGQNQKEKLTIEAKNEKINRLRPSSPSFFKKKHVNTKKCSKLFISLS
jgi:NAD kinase